MTPTATPQFRSRHLFLIAAALATAFALYTNHAWEDYYITYRASKNLATGHGLVFNIGDRLHTFTSPLGVLLPALSSLLTLNRSDTAALWIFRAMSIAAFAGGVAVLFSALLRTHQRVWLAGLGALWLATDAKSLDFTINGMETGFLLLGLAGVLWVQFSDLRRRWLWLGLIWGGLMWTRPDAFLYIGLISIGGWLFGPAARGGVDRLTWIKTCLFAGLVCTAVYLPWFLWAWWYYGSPVPHTIVAKGNLGGQAKTILGALQTFVTLPVKIWRDGATATSLPGAFLPSYFVIGGWPAPLAFVTASLSLVAAFAWLLPPLDARARAASLAFAGFQTYLSYYPYFPFPWYQPGTTLLAFFALAGLVAWLLQCAHAPRPLRAAARVLGVAFAAVLIAFNCFITPAVARQTAAQQRWVEEGNRRKIGEWLHAHAAPGDSVFMEPLGYIGYFSQLKTYDFPGLSSREVVNTIRAVGVDWVEIIHALQPNWLVLRKTEIERFFRTHPSLLGNYYELAERFDVSAQVSALTVFGRNYLLVDSDFTVFHRLALAESRPVTGGIARSRYTVGPRTWEGADVLLVHAPGELTVDIPANAHRCEFYYGMDSGSYFGDLRTDGAKFRVYWESGENRRQLFSRLLAPDSSPADRGRMTAHLELPATSQPARLRIETDPHNNSVKDWTLVGVPHFE